MNGHGEFIAASNAESFSTALTGVLGLIQSRLASGSNVATNSTTFQSDTRMYQATYRTGSWTGDLVARDVTASGGNVVGVTISNNTVSGAGAEGIDLNAGSTGAFTAAISPVVISVPSTGV